MPADLPDRHHVCKTLIRPLTLLGVERRVFFLALLLGAATFNLFYSLLAGLLAFALIYGVARVGTHVDSQIFAIALRSLTTRARYDAARWPVATRRR